MSQYDATSKNSSNDQVGQTYPVLYTLSELIKILDQMLKERGFGFLPVDNHTRPQDDGVLEIKLLDGIFHANLHLRVRHIASEKPSSACTGDENVSFHSRFFSGFGVLYAQVMVDLPLVLDPAGRRPSGADGVEDR